MQWKWYYHKNKRTGYAESNEVIDGHSRTIKMHRLVAICKGLKIDGKQVDHFDTNGLNNQRTNVRLATNLQNSRNQRRAKNNTSGYKGVYWNRTHGKWQVSISVSGHRTHLGLFDDLVKAAQAYNVAATKYFVEFAYLNTL